MDIVYILGTGSKVENEEIRFSLRSLFKHGQNIGKVFVVGECPSFLPGVVHIAMDDPTPEKWKNAYLKTIRACADERISDEFLLMNDDFFFTKDFEVDEWPFYALASSNGGSCGTHSFHVHAPVRINKEMYSKMPFSIEQRACKSPRSFYANFYRAPARFVDDFILCAATGCHDFDEQTLGRSVFSIGDDAMLHTPFLVWLADTYSDASPLERE